MTQAKVNSQTMIERGKSADQLEEGKVNKRLAEAIAQDRGNSHGQGY